MAEWFKAPVLKTGDAERYPGVRIPLLPSPVVGSTAGAVDTFATLNYLGFEPPPSKLSNLLNSLLKEFMHKCLIRFSFLLSYFSKFVDQVR